jgi:hypothetical protein
MEHRPPRHTTANPFAANGLRRLKPVPPPKCAVSKKRFTWTQMF